MATWVDAGRLYEYGGQEGLVPLALRGKYGVLWSLFLVSFISHLHLLLLSLFWSTQFEIQYLLIYFEGLSNKSCLPSNHSSMTSIPSAYSQARGHDNFGTQLGFDGVVAVTETAHAASGPRLLHLSIDHRILS